VDALRIVSDGVNRLKSPENASIIITHYKRLLDYLQPQFIHIVYKGRIVKNGGPELAEKIEQEGYDWIKKEVAE
jgi:Fe-S cluster assembly ATP-binding protein